MFCSDKLKSFHFQNSSHANLQRAFSQVTQINQKMQALKNNDIFDNAHQSPAISSIAQQTSTVSPEKRIFLHEKITLLQSTNDILTSGKFSHFCTVPEYGLGIIGHL